MAEASLLHVAESLLVKLAPYAFKEIKSWWGAKDDLQRLVSSIRTIKAGLLDAEKRQEGRDREGQLVKEWLGRLRNVLYDADDLFDEVITVEESKNTLTGKEKFSKELRQFFSKSNPALFLVDIAGRIKKIRKELDSIKSDMAHFTFDHGLSEKAVCFERETGSVKLADDVIGREEEEKKLMGFLLDGTSKEEGLADVIGIVGFGGLGKTTLAQLLYNNMAVKRSFELHAWSCISDSKGTKAKARIILDALQTAESTGSHETVSSRRNAHEISVNELEKEIQTRVQDKKYLLVVDDYWDEDRNTWLYLMGLLRGGKAGSKILVTTRSTKVAVAMDVNSPHYLKGLTDDKAWELFRRLAFRSATDAENQSLMMMGKEIVKKCKNVPLAIKAIASLLFTCHNDEREWKSVMDSDMLTLELRHENLKILPVLKLSYDHLPSHLKHCFAFCSVFPKDFVIYGESLIFYWISQGYVGQQPGGGQSGLMQIGKSYLKELTSRSFLQKVCNVASWGGYGIYKMHDLMHDLAQEVAGDEILRVEGLTSCPDVIEHPGITFVSIDERTRHLSRFGIQRHDMALVMKRTKYVRSFISESKSFQTDFSDFSCLRLVVIRFMSFESPCSSTGKLKHLRCLILSHNRFTRLPDEICNLHNLKILDVFQCTELKKLPRNLNKLINLICLRVGGCSSLKGMPPKLEALSSLETLGTFIAKESSSEYSGLEALAGLVNLKDESLHVIFEKRLDKKSVDFSSSLVHLDRLLLGWPDWFHFQWTSSDDDDDGQDDDDYEFQCSRLPSNLKRLDIHYFPGRTLPEWKGFNNLLEVFLEGCRKCRYLPSFGKQPRIKILQLRFLDELEYTQMEEDDEFSDETRYFPCLEKLRLVGLPSLKAWSPAMEKLAREHISSTHDVASVFPRFRSLTFMDIQRCPKLMSTPLPLEDRCVCISGALKDPLKTLLKENVWREVKVKNGHRRSWMSPLK